jgi:hypothetical protein
MKQICAFSLFRKGFAAFAALALIGAGVPLFAADLGANNHAANPELAMQPKKVAADYDSVSISRHPACDGGKLPDYVLTGININTSTHKLEVGTLCLPRGESYALNYDFYFYNEFIYNECVSTSSKAYPFMTTNGNTVTIYGGGGTEQAPIGIGWDFFETYQYNSSVQLSADNNFDFFSGNLFRCRNETILNAVPATAHITNNTTIGNNIQKSKDPYGPDTQYVYLVKKGDFVYLFMVKRFKNADFGPDAQKMTLVLRKIH